MTIKAARYGWPRMMQRASAAAYCELSASDFEREVLAGRLPIPVTLGGKDHWNIVQLDECLDRIAGLGVDDWRKEQPGLAA